jgi:hypothetical protein
MSSWSTHQKRYDRRRPATILTAIIPLLVATWVSAARISGHWTRYAGSVHLVCLSIRISRGTRMF